MSLLLKMNSIMKQMILQNNKKIKKKLKKIYKSYKAKRYQINSQEIRKII